MSYLKSSYVKAPKTLSSLFQVGDRYAMSKEVLQYVFVSKRQRKEKKGRLSRKKGKDRKHKIVFFLQVGLFFGWVETSGGVCWQFPFCTLGITGIVLWGWHFGKCLGSDCQWLWFVGLGIFGSFGFPQVDYHRAFSTSFSWYSFLVYSGFLWNLSRSTQLQSGWRKPSTSKQYDVLRVNIFPSGWQKKLVNTDRGNGRCLNYHLVFL